MTADGARTGPYLTGTTTALVESFDGALFDLDGVVYRGPLAVEHAPESIASARAAGMRTAFVTNNANRAPSTVAAQLTSLGVAARPDEVVTSSQAAAALLQARLPAGARVLAVGGPGLSTALEEVGLKVVTGVEDEPVAVVQGFAPTVSWIQLAEAGYAIQAGAEYIATNLDATIPTERGIAPGNGSLVAVVVAATGVVPVSAGKPEPDIFVQAARRVGAKRPLVIGDRLDTDLAGAVAAGYAGLHVLTGVSDAAAAVRAVPSERPTFVAPDLRGLLVAHPEPVPAADGAWTCRGAQARVVEPDGTAEIRETDGTTRTLDTADAEVDLSLDALRALCCAAWARADAGADLRVLPRLRVVAEPSAPAG